jgi:hypothetical protein
LPTGAAWSGFPVPAPPPARRSATARRCSPATFWHASPTAADSLPPFAMWPAFPASDYYGDSVPSQSHQPTTGLPAAGLAGQRGGRPWESSHVHHQPVDEGGAQLFPGSLATSTPQAFLVASTTPGITPPWSRSPGSRAIARCCPAHIHQVGAGVSRLRGFHHWFTARCTFSSRLPDPGRLAVPTRPVVVRAAPTLPRASGVRLPSASAACCDRPQAGPSPRPVR